MQGYIQTGIDEGARLLAGGLGLPEGLTKGYFVRPTVFADVKSGMTIEKEEIFGPVLCIMPFDDEADALRIANETPYGLTNYVRQSMCARVYVSFINQRPPVHKAKGILRFVLTPNVQVQTCDGARRNRLARLLRSGMVEMNGNALAAGSPFGGVKASGRAREGGAWGIEVGLSCLQLQALFKQLSRPPILRTDFFKS